MGSVKMFKTIASLCIMLILLVGSVAAEVILPLQFVDGAGNPSAGLTEVIAYYEYNDGSIAYYNSGVNDGSSVGRITLPTNMPEGVVDYLVFFFREGFIPRGVRTTYYGTGTAPVFNVPFVQKTYCHAPIRDVEFVSVRAGEPLLFNVEAEIEGDVFSPFQLNSETTFIVPDHESYYSADTQVIADIVDPANPSVVIYTVSETKALFAGSKARFEFSVPADTLVPGDYNLIIRSNVVDNQCDASTAYSESYTSRVEVLQSLDDVCHAELYGINTDPVEPINGKNLRVYGEMLSNRFDDGVMGQNDGSVTLNVYSYNDATGQYDTNVYTATTAVSVPNPVTPESYEFNFDWSFGEGSYKIEVVAEADCGAIGTSEQAHEIIVNALPGETNAAPIFEGYLPDQSLNVGESFSVDLSAYAHDADGDALTYSFTNSDNSVATCSVDGSVLTCTGAAAGNTNVRVFASDGRLSASDDFNVEVGVALTAEANGPYTCRVGQTIGLDGNANGGVTPYTYAWDLNNDGSFETSGQNPAYACTSPGAHTVVLQVTDAQGNSATDTAEINASPAPLVAEANGPYTCNIGDTVTLSGSATEGQSPYAYAWDLNDDGSFETAGQNVNFVCSVEGTFDINLRVRDILTTEDTDDSTVTVTIGPEDLTAHANGPYYCEEGDFLTLHGDASGGNGAYAYIWVFEDPWGYVEKAGGPDARFYCFSEGTYTIDLQVRDSVTQDVTDVLGEDESMTYTVAGFDYDVYVNYVGMGLFGEDSAVLEVNGEKMYLREGDTYILEDGAVVGINNIFESPSYMVEFYLGAPGGETDTDAAEIIVSGSIENYAPEITSEPVEDAVKNELYEYDVEAYDPNGDVLYYKLVDYPTGMKIDHQTGMITWTPERSGDFDVKVKVTDPDGLFATQTFKIHVQLSQKDTPRVEDTLTSKTRIVGDDHFQAGETLHLKAGYDNTNGYDFEDITITASVQELGIRTRVGPFDLEDGDEIVKDMYLEIPEDTPKGVYSVRITYANDEFREVEYREFNVI